MKRTKYGNRRAGGYDSGKERRVHQQLAAAQRAHDLADRVTGIARQVTYALLPRQIDVVTGAVIERAVSYTADFVVNYADERTEVIDVKSPPTRKLPAYVIKRKLMLFMHNIRVREM